MKAKSSKKKKHTIRLKKAYQPVKERTALMLIAIEALKAAGCGIEWEIESMSNQGSVVVLKLKAQLVLYQGDIDIATILDRAEK